jgi:hypothetical protein
MIRLEFDATIDTEERILKPPLLARHDGQLIPSPGVRIVHPGNRLGQSVHLNLMVAVGEELLLAPKGDGQKLIIFPSGSPASGHLLDRRIQQRLRVGITAANNQFVRATVETRLHSHSSNYRAPRRFRSIRSGPPARRIRWNLLQWRVYEASEFKRTKP